MEKMPCLETIGLFKESIRGHMTVASEKKEQDTFFNQTIPQQTQRQVLGAESNGMGDTKRLCVESSLSSAGTEERLGDSFQPLIKVKFTQSKIYL